MADLGQIRIRLLLGNLVDLPCVVHAFLKGLAVIDDLRCEFITRINARLHVGKIDADQLIFRAVYDLADIGFQIVNISAAPTVSVDSLVGR